VKNLGTSLFDSEKPLKYVVRFWISCLFIFLFDSLKNMINLWVSPFDFNGLLYTVYIDDKLVVLLVRLLRDS
jgi:hypothetical protein